MAGSITVTVLAAIVCVLGIVAIVVAVRYLSRKRK